MPVKGDDVRVPRGYRSEVLLRWGDPLRADISPDHDPTRMTVADQSACFGYNCDLVGYFPLPFGSTSSDHGLLGVNHEYINPERMFEQGRLSQLSKEQVDLCMDAMGFSMVEVRRIDGKGLSVQDSRFNKRYTATTPMIVTGPARGEDRMKTSLHAGGTTCTGTMHNCAAGKTPWGTVLSGEENFQGMFGNAESLTSEKDRRSAERYGLGRHAASIASSAISTVSTAARNRTRRTTLGGSSRSTPTTLNGRLESGRPSVGSGTRRPRPTSPRTTESSCIRGTTLGLSMCTSSCAPRGSMPKTKPPTATYPTTERCT